MGFRRLFVAISPILFGMCAGGLVLGGVMQLGLRLHPSPEITLSRLGFLTWSHGMIGLSSFAAGVAAAWLHSCDGKGLQRGRLGGVYGFGVACAWFIVMACILWRLVLLGWLPYLLDILLVALAGIVGRRISRRA